MTRQELAEAIKSVLAENTKRKLDESVIRRVVKEVLAEEFEKLSAKGELNEEEYDFIRDIESALGRNPSEERVKQYLNIKPEDELPDNIKSALYGSRSTRTPNYYNKRTGQAGGGTRGRGSWSQRMDRYDAW